MSSRLDAPITMTFSRPSTPSISLSSCGTTVVSTSETPRATGAEDRVHLVEEHDHRGAFRRLLAGALEDQPDVALGLADELVQQLRALDVEEVRLGLARVVAADLGHLLGQRVRHRLGDQRLTAAGRTVEQHPFGRTQRILPVELLVQEGQLHGVADLLDLAGQAADVQVADVGHLFQHQVLDLGLGDALERVAGLGVDQQRVAGPQLAGPGVVVEGVRMTVRQVLGDQRLGEPDDAFLVGVPDHERPVPVGQSSRSVEISPTDSKVPASTTVSASLRRTVWPLRSNATSMFGEHVRRILRPDVNTSTVSSSCVPSRTP